MKVLVTGSEGFFGSWLVPYLEQKKITVVRFDKKKNLDIFDKDVLKEHMKGCDAVLHLAAIPHFVASIPDESFQKVNVEGTRVVAEAAVEAGIKRFVHTSSGGCYGFGEKLFKPSSFPFTAKDTPYDDLDKLNSYGRAKVNAEQLLEKDFADKLDIAVLRVNWIQGRRGSYPEHFHTYCEIGTAQRYFHGALVSEKVKGFEIFNVLETMSCFGNGDPIDSDAIANLYDVPSTVKGNESLAYVGNTIEKLGM